ncbi:F-box domain-containing protein [Mycena sanguinolenta]|uniref:F-box domain-containing protein n=1 Tax=Mycena sanguinolenta TaxID=230812 RepID=A0A8H6ZH71_9AGAR|nr:F-box domain-containing protein [Mycena sanguinolenta]
MKFFEIQNPGIRDRLRYNILPSDAEKSAIQLSIEYAQSRLAEIASETSEEQQSRAALQEYISDCSSLLAPIRQLSIEILQLILADPDIHDTKWIGTYRVARATPILWSSFQVSLRRPQWSDLQLIRTRLELSKKAPLTISFNAGYMYPEDESPELRLHTQAVKEIMAEFLLEAERWACLVLPFEYDVMALLSPAQGRLLRLEALGFGRYVGRQERIEIFNDAPKLRSLALGDVKILHNLPLDSLPWGQLSHLSTPFLSKPFAEVILERSPQLHALVLYAAHSAYLDTPDPDPPRRSPELRTVVLNGLQSKHLSCLDVLGSMDTPALKEIYLSECWAWNPLSIPALLQRSGCSLETLVLEQSRVRPPELLALFPAVASLGTLALVDNAPNAVTNIMVQALTPGAQDVLMLPSLHTLVLRGTYFCSTDKLLDLLESRMRFRRPLINIDIALSDRELRTPDLDRLAAFVGRGAEATYSSSVISIHAGDPGRNVGYLHPEVLDVSRNVVYNADE